MALGYPLEQASSLPFGYIIHPQYMTSRCTMRSPKLYVKDLVKERLSPRTVQFLRPVRARLKMMLGRAFFVYWPAGYRPLKGAPALVPNFGDMRLIQ